MMPNPVPSSFGGTNIGTVGTMIAQKMAMQIPSKNEGIHTTKLEVLIDSVDSVYIMNMYVKV